MGMFQTRILIYLIISLAIFTTTNTIVKKYNPALAKSWNLEFFIFPIGMMAFMILMHFLGFYEGMQEGLKRGLDEAEKVFLFLPHGGLD